MEFRVLGPVQARTADRPITMAGPRQERILAALLLDAGRVVPVSRLVDVVWDADPPATAVRQVRNLTTALRRTLIDAGADTDVIVADGTGFVLRPPVLDLRTFEDHAGRGEYRQALACWRGPALAGLGSAALAGTAACLEERRLSIWELCLADEVAAGEDVVAELSALAAEYPLREHLAGLLMRSLHQRGRQAEALGVYDRVRRRLIDELGVEPGAQLRAVHGEILRGPAGNRAGRCYLPYEVPDFTGRDLEIEQALTAARRGVPVVIDGMAGVGKTAMAVRAANRVAAAFPDGQLFVNLHSYTPGRTPLSPESALGSLLLQLGLPAQQHPDGLDARAALWRARTADQTLLVLLDNAASDDQVLPLLPGSATVAVLVTSRRRLPGIDGAVPVSLDVLPADQAAVLFTAVSGRADEGVGRLCGYLPLAIRIAAARLRHRPQWSTAEFTDRLSSEQNRLAELRTGGRDVAAVFQLSYGELTSTQQRLFRLLGLHPGSLITPRAAVALAAMPEPDTERVLEDLLDANLLGQPSGDGYAFHDLLADHARSLTAIDNATGALDRLLDYYRAGGDEHWHTVELPNLVTITEHALARGRYDHCWQIADHMATYVLDRGHRADFLTIAQAGTTAAHHLENPHALQRSLRHLAVAHWAAGDFDQATACTEQQYRTARDAHDPEGEANALARLGVLRGIRGDYRETIRCCQQALALTENTDDPTFAGRTYGNLSHAQSVLGLFDDALASVQRARLAHERAGDHHGAVLSAAHHAVLLAKLGRHSEAQATADKAVRDATTLDNDFGEAICRGDYAEVLLTVGHPDQARDHAERAVAILTRLNNPPQLAVATNRLAAACHALGEPQAALGHYHRAARLARRFGDVTEETRAVDGLDHVHAVTTGQ
ncbi:hypothetical protein HUW46_09288 [Amycolatopsis sp. CA-230715]|nr:hypothetical protein HUW46_09288 [Amycolatopsis sp. CA-230715]